MPRGPNPPASPRHNATVPCRPEVSTARTTISAAVGGVFHQFEQHATSAGGMYEDVTVSAGADLDFFVDEASARGFEPGYGICQVGDMQSEVMQALSALLQELRNRGVRHRRFK